MARKPVGLLSELIVLINYNNDNVNAVHDVYRAKSCKVYITVKNEGLF